MTRAADDWVRAVPDASFAYSSRAGHRLWGGLHDYQGAADDFTRALELGGLPNCYRGRAEAKSRLGRFDEALADIDRFIQSPTFRPIGGVRTQEQGMFLTSGYRLRGEILEQSGRYDEAERAYRKGLDVALAVVADGPLRDQYLIWPIGEYYASLGNLVLKVGRADEAARLIDSLGEETFENAMSRVWEMMAWTYSGLGVLLSRTNQPRAEERAWRRLILLSQRMARAEPRVPRHDRELARWHQQLADLLRRGGRIAEAEEHDRRAAQMAKRWREAVDRQLKEHPEDAAGIKSVAWWLSTWPVPAMRDAPRAVELARKAVAAEPKNAAYWDALGVALYRAGDWHQAAEALGRSRELLGKVEPRNAFFLAMARWRQGDRENARDQFKQAVAAAGERGLRDDEVNRFHAEAAALLGPAELPADVFARP